MSWLDIKGKRFGKLRVLSREEFVSHGKVRSYWWCLCDCGKYKLILQDNLTGGKSRSCGCQIHENRDYSRADYVIEIIDCNTAVYRNTNGLEFLFSPCDCDIIDSCLWHFGTNEVIGYIIGSSNKTLRLSRLLCNAPKGYVVDHINGNRFDNRRENLRVCTQQENCFNRHCGNHGVRKRGNRWTAAIQIRRKHVHLGTFDTYEEAKAARLAAERLYFGEFAPSFEDEI